MIITDDNFVIISKNSNEVNYWADKIYPKWSSIVTLRPCSNQKTGSGVEPHYHDCDEIWLFTKCSGEAKYKGEVWLNDKVYKITPNTVVYTPMGTLHRFQMFCDFENVAIVTRLEREKRPIHIIADEYGPPEKTVHGFVVSGEENNGPLKTKGKRCPLIELRQVCLSKNEKIERYKLSCNEYWAVLEGDVFINTGKFEAQLSSGDVALLRRELIRELRTEDGCRLALARE